MTRDFPLPDGLAPSLTPSTRKKSSLSQNARIRSRLKRKKELSRKAKASGVLNDPLLQSRPKRVIQATKEARAGPSENVETRNIQDEMFLLSSLAFPLSSPEESQIAQEDLGVPQASSLIDSVSILKEQGVRVEYHLERFQELGFPSLITIEKGVESIEESASDLEESLEALFRSSKERDASLVAAISTIKDDLAVVRQVLRSPSEDQLKPEVEQALERVPLERLKVSAQEVSEPSAASVVVSLVRIENELNLNRQRSERLLTQVESLTESVSEIKSSRQVVSTPEAAIMKEVQEVRRILTEVATMPCHKNRDCNHDCPSLEEIVEGVCNSIVGETYYKWTTLNKYYPSVVFLFVEENVSYPKRAQVKTRWTSVDLENPVGETEIEKLQKKIDHQASTFRYHSGETRCNFVSQTQSSWKTTIYAKDRENGELILEKILTVLDEPFLTECLSVTSPRKRRVPHHLAGF